MGVTFCVRIAGLPARAFRLYQAISGGYTLKRASVFLRHAGQY